jgi:hypothetical protein
MPNPALYALRRYPNGQEFGLPIPDWLDPYIPDEFQRGTICPPGTACSGPSVSLPGGISACIGTCRPFDPGITEPGTDPQPDPFGGTDPSQVCPPGFHFAQSDNLFGSSFKCVPDNGVQVGVNGQVGCGCGKGGKVRCQTATGKCGYKNERPYVRKINRCGPYTKENLQVVPAGAACSPTRKLNYGNVKAARSAMRRVKGAHRTFQQLDKTLRKLAGPAPRRRK